MIVSLNDIPFYQNSKLNADYDDIDLMIPRAAILAYYNMPKINVLKNYEELAQEDSLFSVVKEMRLDQNEQRPIHFNWIVRESKYSWMKKYMVHIFSTRII